MKLQLVHQEENEHGSRLLNQWFERYPQSYLNYFLVEETNWLGWPDVSERWKFIREIIKAHGTHDNDWALPIFKTAFLIFKGIVCVFLGRAGGRIQYPYVLTYFDMHRGYMDEEWSGRTIEVSVDYFSNWHYHEGYY